MVTKEVRVAKNDSMYWVRTKYDLPKNKWALASKIGNTWVFENYSL